MNIKQIPLLYFPPTVIMVDDNGSFLDNFGIEIAYEGLLEKYTSANEAVKQLNVRNTLFNNKDNYLTNVKSDDLDNDSDLRSINYSAVIKTVFNEQRFYEPAIIIVDYSMPEIDGVSFCEKIKNHRSLKIMLTGEADHKIAVNAFNKGIINKFISKDIESSANEIRSIISDFVQSYFINLSNYMWPTTSDITSHKDYIDVFCQWKKEKNILEYYSFSDNGSKLGVDNMGRCMYFLVNSNSDIVNYTDIAVDQHAHPDIIKSLESGDYQLCLVTEEHKRESVHSWGKYLVKTDGEFEFNNQTFHYSFVDNLKNEKNDYKNIINIGDLRN